MKLQSVHYKYRLLKALRLLRTFAGVLGEKNSYVRHFKGKHGKLCIVGKLNKCRFRKNYKLPVSSIPRKKIANNHESDNVSFN